MARVPKGKHEMIVNDTQSGHVWCHDNGWRGGGGGGESIFPDNEI